MSRPNPNEKPKGVWRRVGRWVGIGRNLTQREVDERNAERMERRLERKELREIRQQELKEKREELRQQRELRRLERQEMNMGSARPRQSQIRHSNIGISPGRKNRPSLQSSSEAGMRSGMRDSPAARRDIWKTECEMWNNGAEQEWGAFDNDQAAWQFRMQSGGRGGGGDSGDDIPYRSSSMSRIERTPHSMNTPVRELWKNDAQWKNEEEEEDHWNNERTSREYQQYMNQYSSMPRMEPVHQLHMMKSPHVGDGGGGGRGGGGHMMVSPPRGDPWKNERELWNSQTEEEQLYGPMSTIRLTPNSDNSKQKRRLAKTSAEKAASIKAVESLADAYQEEERGGLAAEEEEGHFHTMYNQKHAGMKRSQGGGGGGHCTCGSHPNELYCPVCDEASTQPRSVSLSRFENWGS